MPSYANLPGVRPKWLSKFLGHKNQTIAISAILLAVPLLTMDWRDLGFAAGSLVGLWMSPDLDLSWTRLGLLGKLGLADEYTKLFKHRKWSHVPVWGTLTRLPVLGIFVLVIWVLLGVPFPWGIGFKVVWGLVVSDWWHVVLDNAISKLFVRRRSFRS